MKRIPRKKKKQFKKLWFSRDGLKRIIIKSSISKTDGFKSSNGKTVWGCITRLKNTHEKERTKSRNRKTK